MSAHRSWRPLRLATVQRAQAMGWHWTLSGRPALRSPRGTIFILRMRPLSARLYKERLFSDAA
jgi:hypothetical protein